VHYQPLASSRLEVHLTFKVDADFIFELRLHSLNNHNLFPLKNIMDNNIMLGGNESDMISSFMIEAI